jgi:hypothetical protein
MIIVFGCGIDFNTNFFAAQYYTSRKTPTVDGFVRDQYHCPYRRKCACVVVIDVGHCNDKVQLFVSSEQTMDCHWEGKGTLTVKAP